MRLENEETKCELELLLGSLILLQDSFIQLEAEHGILSGKFSSTVIIIISHLENIIKE